MHVSRPQLVATGVTLLTLLAGLLKWPQPLIVALGLGTVAIWSVILIDLIPRIKEIPTIPRRLIYAGVAILCCVSLYRPLIIASNPSVSSPPADTNPISDITTTPLFETNTKEEAQTYAIIGVNVSFKNDTNFSYELDNFAEYSFTFTWPEGSPVYYRQFQNLRSSADQNMYRNAIRGTDTLPAGDPKKSVTIKVVIRPTGIHRKTAAVMLFLFSQGAASLYYAGNIVTTRGGESFVTRYCGSVTEDHGKLVANTGPAVGCGS